VQVSDKQVSDKSILIAEDSREMARIVRSLLASLGFQDIEEVPDGATALSKLKKRHYDLLISDIHMEPMNGIELVSELRADDALAAMRVIVMSGSGEETKVLQARDVGVDAYILKPFSVATLKRIVGGVMKREPKKAERAARSGPERGEESEEAAPQAPSPELGTVRL
jgi:CheY-like chemotaxis protein